MRHSNALRTCHQMSLFHRRVITPRWADFPPEAQRQTLKLLIELLREHRRSRLPARLSEGARDE